MIKTVKIRSDFFGKYKNQNELFELVKKWVKSNLVGLEVNIKSKIPENVPQNIELTWQGLKNDLSEFHPPYEMKLLSFSKLNDIISNATYLYQERDKRGRKDIKAIYRFFSRISVDDIGFDVIIIIMKTSKTFLYDHILLQKK
jgi:hypothetical protein